MTLTILYAILEILGMFAVGWLARHFGYIREDELNRWSRFVIDFLMPALVFHSILVGFESGRTTEIWVLPLAGFGIIAFGGAAGVLFRLTLRTGSRDLARTFHHFCAVNNYGFLPILIIQSLWGEPALARLFFLNIGSAIGYWTIGVGLLGEQRWGQTARNILSPNLAATLLALLFALAGWRPFVPELVVNIAGSMGRAAVPCILILVGAGLYPFPSLRHRAVMGYLTLIRLVLLPAATVAAVALFGLPEDVRNVIWVVALMPVPVSSIILTRRYGGDPDFAAGAAVVTTLLSLVTVPAALSLLLR